MSEWPMVKLGELLKPSPKKAAGELEAPILSITMHDGLVEQGTRFKKRIASLDTSIYRIVFKGQLVVGFPIDEGVLDFQDKYSQALVSPAYGVWDLVSDEVTPEFLGLFLKSPRAISIYKSRLRGTTARRRSLPTKVFQEIEFPLPPLGEQKRIAEILGGVSKAIQKTKVQLLLVDILRENKYLSLSKDADTFKSLKDLGVKKITGKSIVAKPDNEHGVNQIIKVSAVSSGRFIASETKPLPADYEPNNLHEIHQGDLLFARASGSANLLGACCIVDKEIQHLYLPDKVWKLEVDEDILPKVYLLQALRGREFRSVAESHFSSSTGVKNIKTSVLMEFKIPVLKKDQLNDYVHFVKTLDNLRHLLHRKLSLLQELQKSLATRAFAGLL